MARVPYMTCTITGPDGLVHRLSRASTHIRENTACGYMLAELYDLDDARSYNVQFTLTNASATCLACVIQPDEIEVPDDEDSGDYEPYADVEAQD